MSRREREETVAKLTERINAANGLIVCDYTGLNVAQITGLRRQVKEIGSEVKVAKNTLLHIAVQGTKYEPLQECFTGQTAIAFIDDDPVMAAKVLTKFLKDNLKENPDLRFKIRAGLIEKDLLNDQQIDQLGNLPAKEVLAGQLVGLLASPLTGFVSVLADIPRKFLRVLTAIAEQKQQSS